MAASMNDEALICEVVYKGATRPPMKWGVPLIALVGVFMPAVIVTLWATMAGIFLLGRVGLLVAPACAVLIGLAFMWMRWVTSRDDQRLNQFLTSLKLRSANPNRGLFGARSYSPYRARGAKDAWRR